MVQYELQYHEAAVLFNVASFCLSCWDVVMEYNKTYFIVQNKKSTCFTYHDSHIP